MTERSGLGFRGYCHGVIIGDIDNDGDQDVFLCNYGGDALFLNNGNGTFSDISQSAGCRAARHLVVERSVSGFRQRRRSRPLRHPLWRLAVAARRPVLRRFQTEDPPLLLSQGAAAGAARALSQQRRSHVLRRRPGRAGIDRADGHGFGAVAADLDGDGRVDLYVANDQDPNFLFLNRGDGTFRDATDESGAGLNIEGRTSAGMGVDAEDLDGDGQPELFVTNFQEEYNTLFKNLRPGTFLDVTAVFGLAVDSLPWIGWGCALADFDGDGWPDIVVANGHIDDNAQLLGQPSGYAQPPLLHRNLGGKRFQLANGRGGALLRDQPRRPRPGLRRPGRRRRPGPGHQPQGRSTRDSSKRHAAAGRWIRLKLVGTRSNRDAIGATVIVEAGGRTIHRLRKGGSSLMSSHDPRLLIGLGSPADFARVTVKWPSGALTRLDKVATNQSHEIREPKE